MHTALHGIYMKILIPGKMCMGRILISPDALMQAKVVICPLPLLAWFTVVAPNFANTLSLFGQSKKTAFITIPNLVGLANKIVKQ